MSVTSSQPAPSMTTADFFVGTTIGEGAFGQVVWGRHKSTRRPVAIKVYDKITVQRTPHVLRSVQTEQRLLATRLSDSDHIISLWASFHDSECLYLVLELCTGGTLQALLKATTDATSRRQLLHSYGLQVLTALEFIHNKRVLHVDLKPDNLLLTDQGIVKLTDFGSAVCFDQHQPTNKAETTYSCHDPRGTADYAAPEVLKGQSPHTWTVAVDLWSYGCLLYAILHGGRSPFHAETDALAVQAVFDHCKQQQTTQLPSDSDHESTLIRGLLHPTPQQRIGLADATKPPPDEDKNDPQHSSSWTYASIRSNPIWSADEIQTTRTPPPTPKWWETAQQRKDDSMRDGALGWVAFLG